VYLSTDNELQLLASLAKGERTATENIYRQHKKMISSWVKQNGGSEDEVEDIFQEAMVILYEKAQQEVFRLECKIGTYLFAICKNLWYKRFQQQKKSPSSLPDSAGDEIDWAYDDDIKAHEEREMHYEQLNNALDQLGEPCSSILKAYYHEDKNMNEIAADFGYTNSENAKTQKYKCLQRLKKLFYGIRTK